MRSLAVMMASAAMVCMATFTALAQTQAEGARDQARAARSCASVNCLLKQVVTLETEMAGLKKQLDDLGTSTIKFGQTISLDAPSGCLSYSDPSRASTGPVWWSKPCQNGDWVIQTNLQAEPAVTNSLRP